LWFEVNRPTFEKISLFTITSSLIELFSAVDLNQKHYKQRRAIENQSSAKLKINPSRGFVKEKMLKKKSVPPKPKSANR